VKKVEKNGSQMAKIHTRWNSSSSPGRSVERVSRILSFPVSSLSLSLTLSLSLSRTVSWCRSTPLSSLLLHALALSLSLSLSLSVRRSVCLSPTLGFSPSSLRLLLCRIGSMTINLVERRARPFTLHRRDRGRRASPDPLAPLCTRTAVPAPHPRQFRTHE
jgi:hypothetical protein